MINPTAMSVIQARQKMDDKDVIRAANISPATMTRAARGLPINIKIFSNISLALKCDPSELIKDNYTGA